MSRLVAVIIGLYLAVIGLTGITACYFINSRKWEELENVLRISGVKIRRFVFWTSWGYFLYKNEIKRFAPDYFKFRKKIYYWLGICFVTLIVGVVSFIWGLK